MTSDPKSEAPKLMTQVTILLGFVALFWVVEIVDVFIFHGALDRFGIVPRHLIGLRGILFAPFLHGGFPHVKT
ncbi:MAG: rhomboid family intramembrane serine protease, partial [Cyanobacteria bacterium P01_H01_bin.15]